MSFTKRDAQQAYDSATEMMKALPSAQVKRFVGHFNTILLFINDARRVAPDALPDTESAPAMSSEAASGEGSRG